MSREYQEHHIEVVRTARYWTLGPRSGPGELWYGLHGYRQLGRRLLRRFEPIDDGSRLVVAPDALSRFYVSQERGRHGAASVVGGTWMTRDDREAEIHDYVRYLDRLHDRVTAEAGEAPPVTILGFSQGVATACRWVTLGDVRPARLILWGDVSPPDLDLERAAERFADVDVVLVRGDSDGALAPQLVEEEAERLASASIAHRIVRYDGGHDIDPETLKALASEG